MRLNALDRKRELNWITNKIIASSRIKIHLLNREELVYLWREKKRKRLNFHKLNWDGRSFSNDPALPFKDKLNKNISHLYLLEVKIKWMSKDALADDERLSDVTIGKFHDRGQSGKMKDCSRWSLVKAFRDSYRIKLSVFCKQHY